MATVNITIDNIMIEGSLEIPKNAEAIVIFVHGSGSSRHSPRNIFVATKLQTANFATLLFDLLTPAEDEDYNKRFDTGLLATRLKAVTTWVKNHPLTKGLLIGYFGASTGAAAALMAAADLPYDVKAVVSRGGRPDLASAALAKVQAPTLLIVGGEDRVVVGLNSTAYAHLTCIRALEIIPDANHLFEEPGALEAVADKAQEWFTKYLDISKSL